MGASPQYMLAYERSGYEMRVGGAGPGVKCLRVNLLA